MKKICELGEKEIIKSIIKPILNPLNDPYLVGDDCAIIDIRGYDMVSISTDRVPADLISFQNGIIDFFELGNYLAVLNISDIVSSGAKPYGLVLTFAFPDEFYVDDLKVLIEGVKYGCDKYDCKVLGGDLSHSIEMSISATAFGLAKKDKVLFRRGSEVGDYLFCTDFIGLTSTAFYYILKAEPNGMCISDEERKLLFSVFRDPKARISQSVILSEISSYVTCMDNTDGVGQTFKELVEINGAKFIIDIDRMPVHDISYKVAEYLNVDVNRMILDGGADFQLLGSVRDCKVSDLSRWSGDFYIIGEILEGTGLWLKDNDGIEEYMDSGWNYFKSDN